jgi:hypothetical protein
VNGNHIFAMSADGGQYFLFDERYAEGMLHEPRGHRVLGKRLRPYSLWHRLQLEYTQSKVLLGGAKMWDLWCAVQICRTEYPVRAGWDARWGMWNGLWHRLWKMRYGWRGKRWTGRYFAGEMRKFVAYVGDYQSGPKLWGGKGSAVIRYGEALEALGRELGDEAMIEEGQAAAEHGESMGSEGRDIDETLEQVGIAVKLGGLPLERAWNMAGGELGWLNVALLKMEGGKINIWTPTEEERFAKHKLEREKKIDELAAELAEEEEFAGETRVRVRARAAVRYWEQVVRNLK